MKGLNIVLLCSVLFTQQVCAETMNVQVKHTPQIARMGDLMIMHVAIHLPKNRQLDSESLPLTGRVTPWLDLRTVDYEQRNQALALTLQWQIFATVEKSQILKTPPITLKIQGQPNNQVRIPSQPFYYAAGLPYPLPELQRQGHLPPLKFDEHTPLIHGMWSGFLGLVLLSVWAWLKDLLPFLPFKNGPISLLARELRNKHITAFSDQQLQHIHHALNKTAGLSLYPSQLSVLFDKAPYLRPFERAIQTFFLASWSQQYAVRSFTAPQTNDELINVQETLCWIKQAAIAERLYLKSLAS